MLAKERDSFVDATSFERPDPKSIGAVLGTTVEEMSSGEYRLVLRDKGLGVEIQLDMNPSSRGVRLTVKSSGHRFCTVHEATVDRVLIDWPRNAVEFVSDKKTFRLSTTIKRSGEMTQTLRLFPRGLPSLEQMSAALAEHLGASEVEVKARIDEIYESCGYVSREVAAAVFCRSKGIDLKNLSSQYSPNFCRSNSAGRPSF